jgi:hypothetical protein
MTVEGNNSLEKKGENYIEVGVNLAFFSRPTVAITYDLVYSNQRTPQGFSTMDHTFSFSSY